MPFILQMLLNVIFKNLSSVMSVDLKILGSRLSQKKWDNV